MGELCSGARLAVQRHRDDALGTIFDAEIGGFRAERGLDPTGVRALDFAHDEFARRSLGTAPLGDTDVS